MGFDGYIKGLIREVLIVEHGKDEMERSFGMVGFSWRVEGSGWYCGECTSGIVRAGLLGLLNK